MDKQTVDQFYRRWLEANREKTEYYKANIDAWDEGVDAIYGKLANRAEALYNEYAAAATGKTVDQVAYEINERIHCRYD